MSSTLIAPLRLRAEDRADTLVMAACMQDAIGQLSEMAFQPEQKRFCAVFVRFRHETFARNGERTQTRSALVAEYVCRTLYRDLPVDQPACPLTLLTIGVQDEAPDRVAITLAFDAGAIRLVAERLTLTLEDFEPPWPATAWPEHR